MPEVRFHNLAAALCLLAGPAMAEVSLPEANACFDAALEEGTNPALCIDAAQDSCLDNAQDTPAVSTLCFHQGRDVWSEGLRTIFASTIAEADETFATVARIETRYDLLANLLQCDRVEELSMAASDLDGAAIALQKTRCQATATALTYMRLYMRSRTAAEEDTP